MRADLTRAAFALLAFLSALALLLPDVTTRECRALAAGAAVAVCAWMRRQRMADGEGDEAAERAAAELHPASIVQLVGRTQVPR
jgi:hypothetical protein